MLTGATGAVTLEAILFFRLPGTNSVLVLGLNDIVKGFIVAALGAEFSFTGLKGFEARLGAAD